MLPNPRNRPTAGAVERRIVGAVEFRATDDEKKPQLQGYAAVFNKRSELIFGEFVEIIEPGAFSEAIPKSDIRALQNHDPNFVLGRTKSGTLEVSEDDVGLKTITTLPDTQYARDLLTVVRRGDVNQMSFSFTVAKGGVQWTVEDDETIVRHILKVEELFDISPVTFPAYPDTSIAERELRDWQSARGPLPTPLRRRAEQQLKTMTL